MLDLSQTINRKFIDTQAITDWEIATDTGWADVTHSGKTIEYEVYRLTLENGQYLECADTHIVFDSNMNQRFVCELTNDDSVMTESGPVKVKSVESLGHSENMWDFSVDSQDHRYYTNGILSHNTTTAAGYLLWHAMFIPDSTILVAAHIFAGAQEIMARIRFAYECIPDHIRAGSVSYNRGSIEFDNGSRIVSRTTTPTTGRGMSITCLYLDEFSSVRPGIAAEFWSSINPTLSTGGKAIITSTPNNDEDLFATIWKQANQCIDEYGNPTELGINGFKAYKAIWSEHPDRDQAWADEQRSQLGEEMFRREHCCEFVSQDETLISPLILNTLKGIDPVEKQGQIRWYSLPQKDSVYMISLDPSIGTGGDMAAIEVFESPSMRQVAEWQHNRTPIQKQILVMRDIATVLASVVGKENVYYTIENNSLGEAALVAISEHGEENIDGIFLSEPGKPRKGFSTTNKSKLAACSKFKNLLENNRIEIKSKNVVSELKTYVSSGASYAAKAGSTDDLVSSVLLIIRMAQVLKSYHPDLDTHITDRETEIIEPMPFICSIG